MAGPTMMPELSRENTAASAAAPALPRAALARVRLLTSFVALASAHAAHGEQLYVFVDDQGVSHFSDAPSDPRHRAIPGTRFQSNVPRLMPAVAQPRSTPEAVSRIIHETARETGVHPALLEAIASVESGFNGQARSPKGALGVMQLMPQTASRFGVSDPFDLRQNISGGARYLRELIDRFNALPLALAAYNAGEGAVSRYGNTIPPYPETLAYVPKVLDRFQRGLDAQHATASRSAYHAPTARLTATRPSSPPWAAEFRP